MPTFYLQPHASAEIGVLQEKLAETGANIAISGAIRPFLVATFSPDQDTTAFVSYVKRAQRSDNPAIVASNTDFERFVESRTKIIADDFRSANRPTIRIVPNAQRPVVS